MNETVYLFALSVPDLLEQILADQAVHHLPAVVLPQPEGTVLTWKPSA